MKRTIVKMRGWILPSLFCLSAFSAQAQTTYSDLSKEVASDRATGDRFGASIAISGDYAVVGAPYHAHGATACGSAYIFKRDPSTGVWTEVQEIYASDRAANDHFGWSVAISGNYVIVGAPDEDENISGGSTMANSGSVYFFLRNTSTGIWSQTQKMVASDRAAGDQYGWSVSILGTRSVVGAPYKDDAGSGSDAGAIYTYLRNGSGIWNLTNKAMPGDIQMDDHFGYSVVINNAEIVVGAPDQDYDEATSDYRLNAGAAYCFGLIAGGTWDETQKLAPIDRVAGDRFGFSVHKYEVHIIVGAPYQDYGNVGGLNYALDAGAAYIFRRDADWSQMQKITSADRAAGDHFGYSVAMSNMDAVVGAPDEAENASGGSTMTNAGSVYIFNPMPLDIWLQKQKRVAPDRSLKDYFGSAVAISETRIVAGAQYEDDDVAGSNFFSSAGSMYVLEGCPYPGHTTYDVVPYETCLGESAEMDAVMPFASSYQWEINTGGGYTTLTNGGVYSGATTAYLNVSVVSHCMHGYKYRCKVTSACGAISYSGPQMLQVYGFDFTDQVISSDLAVGDNFGYSAAISGTYAIVGALSEDHDASGGSPLSDAGSAYIYEMDGSGNWVQVKKIVASTRQANAYFGWSVAMLGEYAVVGAYGDDVSGQVNAGAVYIYKRVSGVWTFWQKLTAPVVTANDDFGISVGIDDQLNIIVGSEQEDQDAAGANTMTDAGAAYIYSFDMFSLYWNVTPQKIVPNDRAAGDWFGNKVDIDGDYAIVSSSLNDKTATGGTPLVTNRGAAYIFRNVSGTWTQVKKLVGEAVASELFGQDVSIDENYAVVSSRSPYDAAGAGTNLPEAGKIYIFDANTSWGLTQRLVAPVRYNYGYFGWQVSISGNYLAATSLYDGANKSHCFIYEKCSSGWTLLSQKLAPSNSGDGRPVDIAGGYIITAQNDLQKTQFYWGCLPSALKSAGNDGESAEEITDHTITDTQPGMECYPNPAVNELNMVLTDIPQGNMSVIITDLNGRVISSINITGENNKISVEQLVPGVYFIQLNYNGGELIRKFIKG